MNRTNTLSFNQKNDLFYITFPSFDRTNLVNHCFSTRLGGVSSGIFESLNLGYGRGDIDSNVDKNYDILCEAVDINPKRLVFSNQIHETKIKMITENDLNNKIELKGIDGLITNLPKVPLVTLYADCVPLLFLDPIKKVIGAAHAGWRGTVKRIGLEMIQTLKKHYYCDPKDILVGIGPSIGQCCFEVDQPVADEFQKTFTDTDKIISEKPNNKYMIDLWEANRNILLSSGIISSNITVTDLCTKCNKDIFFSHRGHNGKRGSLGAIIELK